MDLNTFIADTFLDACYFAARMNTATRQIFPMKLDNQRCGSCAPVFEAEDFAANFLSSGTVYEEDLCKFRILTASSELFEACIRQKYGSLLVFRRIEGDRLIWMRLNLMVSDEYSDENPWVLLYAHEIQEKEVHFYDACSTMTQRIHKVIKVDMMNDTLHVVQEYEAESHNRKTCNYLTDQNMTEEIRLALDYYVHPEDITHYQRHIDRFRIQKHFEDGNPYYQFYYRRKIGQLYRWVKLMVLPAPEYTAAHPVFFYYIQDVHTELLKLIDMNAAITYTNFYGRNKQIPESYYQNLLDVLSTFTHPYVNLYMIDLDKDLFIRYKINNSFFLKNYPYVDNYSESSANFIREYFSGAEAEEMKRYSTSKQLKEIMKDRTTLEYTFTYQGQLLKTTCVKMESFHGIPRRLLCSTVICPEENRLVIHTFGNFEVYLPDGKPVTFSHAYSRQLLAYLVDRQGYPVSYADIVEDILQKDPEDKNAVKYVSTLVRRAINELTKIGYPNLIVKEQKTLRLNTKLVDCDYYHILDGDIAYWTGYHNEYMKEYSWAEETNAEIQSMNRR